MPKLPRISGAECIAALRRLGFEAVRHENSLTASDLGRLLGSRDLGSKILRRERELSKAHMLILGDRFQVDPGLFLA